MGRKWMLGALYALANLRFIFSYSGSWVKSFYGKKITRVHIIIGLSMHLFVCACILMYSYPYDQHMQCVFNHLHMHVQYSRLYRPTCTHILLHVCMYAHFGVFIQIFLTLWMKKSFLKSFRCLFIKKIVNQSNHTETTNIEDGPLKIPLKKKDSIDTI